MFGFRYFRLRLERSHNRTRVHTTTFDVLNCCSKSISERAKVGVIGTVELANVSMIGIECLDTFIGIICYC